MAQQKHVRYTATGLPGSGGRTLRLIAPTAGYHFPRLIFYDIDRATGLKRMHAVTERCAGVISRDRFILDPRPQIVTRRAVDENTGAVSVHMSAKPGHAIVEIFEDIADPDNGLSRFGVITGKPRGPGPDDGEPMLEAAE